MRQCLNATAKVAVVVLCYRMSKESTFCVKNFVVNLKLKN